MKPQSSCAGAAVWFNCRANNSRQGWKEPSKPPHRTDLQIEQVKVRRDSQGSLPKTGASTYVDEKATEL
jgi:hypothetical protein